MDANLQTIHRRLGKDEDKLTLLAKCVRKLMVAQGVACENNGIDRSEWDASAYALDEAFEFNLFD